MLCFVRNLCNCFSIRSAVASPETTECTQHICQHFLAACKVQHGKGFRAMRRRWSACRRDDRNPVHHRVAQGERQERGGCEDTTREDTAREDTAREDISCKATVVMNAHTCHHRLLLARRHAARRIHRDRDGPTRLGRPRVQEDDHEPQSVDTHAKFLGKVGRESVL
mgnify:CR=1 FL=1